MPPPSAHNLSLVDPVAALPEKSTSRPATGESRNQILIAAAECFKENGFAATSIDDVAHYLGATKGKIYHHFRSKMDLFFAVYRRGMEINFEATQPEAQSSKPALIRLVRMALAHSVALMAHQPFQRVLAQGVAMHQTGSTTAAQRETLDQLIRTRDTYESLFKDVIEQATSDANVPVANASLATKSFLSVLNATVFWYSPRKDNPLDEQIALASELATFALQGLGLQLPANAIEDWKNSYE